MSTLALAYTALAVVAVVWLFASPDTDRHLLSGFAISFLAGSVLWLWIILGAVHLWSTLWP